ncbi:pirin [Tritrichomonas foetus]|uniref:Pirin n=1 Tax=Tritrichomonas foetus TaxID=1144522 RepID=A0A1J4KDD8_9EUKA|nr:pirin [Tritrichomonas foetus]|eukprot:OHT09211.1 pirin [Tritrichomonas foetus]
MFKILDKADSRGISKTNWLLSYHTFSFNRYYNPDRMGFGELRVLNDDIINPSKGFGQHPHDNMEILTIPLSGEITHGDSEGNRKSLKWGQIQVMTAGSGIYHSEMNNSASEECKLLQIWVNPNQRNLPPAYHNYDIMHLLKRNQLNLIVSPNDEVPATLNQDAWFSLGEFDKDQEIVYNIHSPSGNGVYIFMIEGKAHVANENLSERDGMGIAGCSQIEIKTELPSKVLTIEVPVHNI